MSTICLSSPSSSTISISTGVEKKYDIFGRNSACQAGGISNCCEVRVQEVVVLMDGASKAVDLASSTCGRGCHCGLGSPPTSKIPEQAHREFQHAPNCTFKQHF